MIDRIFTWIVTRKFGVIFFSFFHSQKNGSQPSLDLSLSSPFQGLFKIYSERALKLRKKKQMLIKPPQKSLIDKSMVLKMAFLLSYVLTQQVRKEFIVGNLCNHFQVIAWQGATCVPASLCFRNPGFIIRALPNIFTNSKGQLKLCHFCLTSFSKSGAPSLSLTCDM